MKQRNLGFFQQHAEKLVLGVAALVAVALVLYAWTGLLGQPHVAEVNGQTIRPGEADVPLERVADRLRASLEADTTSLPERAAQDYRSRFVQRYQQPVTQQDRLTSPLFDSFSPELTEGPAVAYNRLERPEAPFPEEPVAVAGHAVLDLQAPGNSTVQQAFGIEAPGDVAYVSVVSDFPMAQWISRLEADGQPRNTAIPASVWRARLGLAGVYLLREELDPVSGEFGDTRRIDPLPGQLLIDTDAGIVRGLASADDAEPSAAVATLDGQLALLRDNQTRVARPDFPALVGEAWAPIEATGRILDDGEKARLAELEVEIQRAEAQLARVTGPGGGDRRGPGQRPRRGPFNDAEFSGGPAARGGEAASTPQERRVQRLEDELDQLRAERSELLGVEEPATTDPSIGGVDAAFYGEPAAVRATAGAGADAASDVDFPDLVRVWAHDLSARPGRTYRYKLVPLVINPLFNYSRLPQDQLEANRSRLTLAPPQAVIDAAAWSEPVTLEPDRFYFLRSASLSRATVEVWKRYEGRLRRAEFQELAGDRLGGVADLPELGGPVDLSLPVVVVGIDTVLDGQNRQQTRVVFLEESDQLVGRYVSEDRRDAIREELIEQSGVDDRRAARSSR